MRRKPLATLGQLREPSQRIRRARPGLVAHGHHGIEERRPLRM
jgi:hypothetical protein